MMMMMMMMKKKKERKTHYHSLYKNVERREQLQLILARFLFLCTSWQRTNWSQNIDQTQHTDGSFLFSTCLFSAGAYTYTIQTICIWEKPSLSMLCEQHTAGLSSRFINIYIQYSSSDPFPRWWRRKASFRRSDFFFFLLYDVDLSLMNWTSEYVLALYSITLVAEGSLLFLSHLLYRTDHVCLLMILFLPFALFLGFFLHCLSEENRDVFVCIEPSTTCHRHHHTGRLLTDS